MGKVGIRELYRNVLSREPYFGRIGQIGPKADDLLNSVVDPDPLDQ
jgi:hypothetical protein